ncbi:MAG: hypothetical protein ACYCSS_09180 [Sulfuriferula sp.]
MAKLTKRWSLSGWKWATALIGLLLFSMTVAAGDASDSAGRVPEPVIAQGKGTACVRSTEYMRRNHMKLLLHERYQEVHYGIRDKNNSLENCVNCHASHKNNSVLGTNQNFCQSCHSYAAVKIDCFECHSSKPQTTADEAVFHPLMASSMTADGTHPEAHQLEMLMRQQMLDAEHGNLDGNYLDGNLAGASK